ncbi:MAG: hypothetical protein E7264_11040 [Lachnospiraceae bacterium]|nr:hypothetical protein [Lachnospiraceae bacterium]
MTILSKGVLLEIVQPDPLSILKGVSTRYKYEDGKKTEEITGYVYDCVNTGTYDFVRVLVEGGKKPIITNEELVELQENGEHVFVEFENARIRPYYSTITKQIEDSIKADGVHIVKNN